MSNKKATIKCRLCENEYIFDGSHICLDCRKIYEYYIRRYSSYELKELLSKNGSSTDLHVCRDKIYFSNPFYDMNEPLDEVLTKILGVKKVEYCLCEIGYGIPHYADVCYYDEISKHQSNPKQIAQHKNRVKYLKSRGFEIDGSESWVYIDAKFDQYKKRHLSQLYGQIEKLEKL